MIRFSLHQIDPDSKIRRTHKFCTCREILSQPKCSFPPPEKEYQTVYEACQPSFDPDAILTRFNMFHPKDFTGHSLSTSDIIRYHLSFGKILNLYCNRDGYMAIDFSLEKEIEREPKYTPATAGTSELVTLYYKSGKSKVITVNISHLFPGRCTGIDQDGDTVNLTPAEIYNVLRTCELGRFQIRRKEDVKSLTGWQDSYLPEFGDYFFPGDFVTESVVEHYRNILPPVRMYHGYLQAGEPHCYIKNDKGIPRACYMTFIKPDTEWIYAGICFEGENENRVPVKSLNEKFVHLMGGIL